MPTCSSFIGGLTVNIILIILLYLSVLILSFFNHNINFVIFVRDAGEDAHSGCIALKLL